MKYVVCSTAVTDEIHFADGSCIPHAAGGAGIYALAGMKLWSDDVEIVTGVGADYLSLYGGWYRKNHLPVAGLIVKDAHTPHNIIRYFPDGERTETPKYGPAHYARVEATAQELARHCADAKGVYLFKNAAQSFWDEILELKQKHGFCLMWEIAADAACLEQCGRVREIAAQADLLSINRTESLRLLGVDSLEQAARILLQWHIPMIYLRMGSRGAWVLAGGRAVHVPSAVDGMVIDVTGGGNSASGGALVGFCETGDAVRAARMGSLSASMCIAQYGVPETMDAALRARAYKLLERMEAEQPCKVI